MKTFHELYLDILKQEAGKGRILEEEYDPFHMNCLLHPEKYAPVIFAEECEQCAYERACENSCIFDAFERDENGKVVINPEKCIGCVRRLRRWDLREWSRWRYLRTSSR